MEKNLVYCNACHIVQKRCDMLGGMIHHLNNGTWNYKKVMVVEKWMLLCGIRGIFNQILFKEGWKSKCLSFLGLAYDCCKV